MNEIVSLAKENELQDYKLIYPNNKKVYDKILLVGKRTSLIIFPTIN